MTKRRAILDADGVYQGHEPVDGLLAPGDVDAGDGDLDPGKYRWTGDQFVYMGEIAGERMLEHPPILRAVALGFAAIDAADPDLLPAETKDLLRWFSTTIDARGPKG